MSALLHVSFDLWNTILTSNRAFKPQRSLLLKEYFGLQAAPETITEAFYNTNKLANQVNNATCLCLDATELLMLVLAAVDGPVETVTPAQLEEFYNLSEEIFLQKAAPPLLNPRAAEELEQLRRQGITTSILSNTAFTRGRTLVKLLRRLGLAHSFNFMLFSDEIGCSKPADQAFELLFEKAEALHEGRLTRPAQVAHIGDDARLDVEAARRHGIKGVLYTPPGAYLPLLAVPSHITES